MNKYDDDDDDDVSVPYRPDPMFCPHLCATGGGWVYRSPVSSLGPRTASQ